MAIETFVDTSGFFALLASDDPAHEAAVGVLREGERGRRRFVTTDYVLDEAATLLSARRKRHLARALLHATLHGGACRIEWTDAERFHRAADFFERHSDQPWSFTDCLSFLVMRQHRIRDALTRDDDFRKAGFTPLLGTSGA
ncbi:MAG: PIN domain-containing protein [Planctomycetota bacterium]